MVNRKEPEPEFVILAPASGGNLISAPQLRLRNTANNYDPQRGHLLKIKPILLVHTRVYRYTFYFYWYVESWKWMPLDWMGNGEGGTSPQPTADLCRCCWEPSCSQTPHTSAAKPPSPAVIHSTENYGTAGDRNCQTKKAGYGPKNLTYPDLDIKPFQCRIFKKFLKNYGAS